MIVVGVLVALGADAAWDGKVARDREREALVDLLEEFEVNDTILTRDIRANEASYARARELVRILRVPDGVEADSMAGLLSRIHEGGRFDPVTGALRSVIDGGDLALIRNRDLRRALAGWSDRAEEARQTSLAAQGINLTVLEPMGALIEDPSRLGPGDEAVLASYLWAAQNASFQQEPLLDELREIADLIRHELDR